MARALGPRSTLAMKLVPRSSIRRRLTKFLGGIDRRRQYWSVSGTAAQMAAKIFPQFRLVWIRTMPQIIIEGHQDACGAKPALQRMMAAERILQNRQPPGRGRKAFDGADFGAVRLYRKREAGTCRHAVNLDGASTADTVLAADMRASHAELVAQEIGEQHTRLGVGLDRAAVELEPHAVARIGG